MKLEDCKPGVRVAAYDSIYRAVGEVHFINDDGLVILKTSVGNYHPKQLRKLKPKEKKEAPPREVYVSSYKNDLLCVHLTKETLYCPVDGAIHKYRLVEGKE